MTIIDDRTTNRNYKKPAGANRLEDDVTRLRQALDAIDADILALLDRRGALNGVASLVDGKVPATQMPNTDGIAEGASHLYYTDARARAALQAATATLLGGIKVGAGLSIGLDGVLSAIGAGGTGVPAFNELVLVPSANGQTVFTPSGGYTVGCIELLLNGVCLIGNGEDYTASNGTSITLTAGITTDDRLLLRRWTTADSLPFSSLTAKPTTLSGYGITDAYGTSNGHLSGHRNKLLNGSGAVNQRSVTSVADDVYFSDRWYALHESGNVTVAHVSDPESGAISGFRLTQPDATAKRIGLAQIIERNNIRQCASSAMNLFARVKCSSSTAIRFAVLEHTGTADVVTSDVVNNWSSSTFTAGNFFITGLNVVKTGTVTPGAATWGSINDWSALGANVNNVVVFFWTEAALAQSGTLEVNRAQYEPGAVATPFEWRMNELQLCQRYFTTSFAGSGKWGTSTTCSIYGRFPVTMRATPTATIAASPGTIEETGVANRNVTGISSSVLTTDGGSVIFVTAAAGSGSIAGLSSGVNAVAGFNSEL